MCAPQLAPQARHQRGNGLAAMTLPVLFKRLQFRGGTGEAVGLEQRVVTEAAIALGPGQHAAVPAAFGEKRRRILGVAQQYEAAIEIRATLRFGQVAQVRQQACVVGRVIAVTAGVARRI